jgi:hypothetical protein
LNKARKPNPPWPSEGNASWKFNFLTSMFMTDIFALLSTCSAPGGEIDEVIEGATDSCQVGLTNLAPLEPSTNLPGSGFTLRENHKSARQPIQPVRRVQLGARRNRTLLPQKRDERVEAVTSTWVDRQRTWLADNQELRRLRYHSNEATVKHWIFPATHCPMNDALAIPEHVSWRDLLRIHSHPASLDGSLIILGGVCDKLLRKDLQKRPANPPLFHMRSEVEVVRLNMPQTTIEPVADMVKVRN